VLERVAGRGWRSRPPPHGDRPVASGHITRVVVDTAAFLHDPRGGQVSEL
jgi:hypothetical protein